MRSVVAGGVVLVVLAYAVLATRWTGADPGWYAGLDKPAWQPPDWVFGVAWPYNFLAIGTAGITLALERPTRTSVGWLVVLAGNVALALTWAYLFYVPHALTAAAVALGASALTGWLLAAVAWRALPWTGWVLLPYALWLTVATSLAVGFAVRRTPA